MKSMTGFGRGEARGEGVTWNVECGSVNRKQLEVAVNLPRELAELENAVRTEVATAVSRGRINVAVRREAASAQADAVRIDHALAAHYFHAMHTLALKLDAPITERFGLYGKLGVAHNKVDGSTPAGQPVINIDGSKNGLLTAFGLQYRFDAPVTLRAELTNFGKSSAKSDAGGLSVGLAYRF